MIPPPVSRYYTVGLDALADMQRSYLFGLSWTPHTKIKVDDDVPRIACILEALAASKPAAGDA